jgi:hypothetical protein
MLFFQHAAHWQDGKWQIRDEMRASAFHVVWMMRYYHPRDEGYDWLYRATFTTRDHEFLSDASARWPNPVGISPELLALYAEDAMPEAQGGADPERPAKLGLPLTWKDDARGYLIARNSWKSDDLMLGFTCKQDFFYGGHEGSENNRLTLWAHGVNWVRDVNMLAMKTTALQNMLTVDGKGLTWPPAPGVWLGVRETPGGVTASGDGRIGYSYGKVMQVHPLEFPSAKLPYYAPFAEGNFDLTRDLQVAFHPGTVRWNDGYAHTDYGPWSGETRLVEHYRSNNPMEQAYRTVHLARGKNPYVLVIDDARKDGGTHLFEWNIALPKEVVLVEAKTPEIQFQNVEPTALRENDLLLGLAGTPRDPKTGKLQPRKGDPLLLVRTLWRQTDYGVPVPRLQHFAGEPPWAFTAYSHLSIPAIARSPEFRVMLYPHRHGDPLPVTRWNDTRTELAVEVGGQRDLYRFGAADGGRTVLSRERGGAIDHRSEAAPGRPVLEVRGQRFDPSELRQTRRDGEVPVYRFDGEMRAALVRPAAPAWIAYTLDGSEPGDGSARYDGPLRISGATTLKARVIDPSWTSGPRASDVLEAKFEPVRAAAGVPEPPAGSRPGLLARVYEKRTVMWDDRGFFRADKIMLPDVSKAEPLVTATMAGFALPHAVPSRPLAEQAKGFYRFTGFFRAETAGVYRFAVDSCGPVALEVGGQRAVWSDGIFHQQQAVRRGEAVLGAGWHAFDLVVCDPVFWNLATADTMPFRVLVAREAGPEVEPDAALLRWNAAPDIAPAAQPRVASIEPSRPIAWTEPGVVLSVFEREGKTREPDYLDLDGLKPLRVMRVSALAPNARPGLVRRYDGWFRAPVDGVYAFDLPARRAANAGLGEFRAAYQSQMLVGGTLVVQRGIAGRYPVRQVGLKAGWYPVQIRVGSGLAEGTVTYPDGQTLALTAAELVRPSRVGVRPEGCEPGDSAYEIFGPTKVELALPEGRAGEIRYTLDGRVPTAADPKYGGPLTLEKSAVLTALAFDGGAPATEPEVVRFERVQVPSAQRIWRGTFAAWDGKPGSAALDASTRVWIAPGTELRDGRGGPALAVHPALSGTGKALAAVDANLTRGAGNAGFRVSGLRMLENAISVGVWFRSETGEGKIFGKDGYNAFGKSYKTVSCILQKGGRFRVGPGNVSGGKISADGWHHVVVTGDAERLALYVDGERVAEGPGGAALATDALDFFTDHSALVEGVAIYNRVLSPRDVKQWFSAERDGPVRAE